MALNDILDKKIGPVPVIYIAAGGVAIFGVVAWRMKPSKTPTDTTPAEDAVLDENGLADGTNPYAGLTGSGTVIVQPPVPVPDKEANRPDTNAEWIREGAEWLVANKDVPGTAAYSALSKYVEGKSRSADEARYIEWVIKEKGFPPDPFTETPSPSAPTPGGNNSTPKPTGYRGYGWAKADGKTTGAQYAAKYQIPVSMFYTFNPSQPNVPRAGTWLKVRANSNPLTGYRGS